MNKRTLSFIAIGVVVLAAGGLFALKTTYESKVKTGIENFLANLPAPMEATAGKIDVSFFDKSVVISDITGSYKGKEAVSFSLAKISATGINADAAKEGAGTTAIAKSLLVEKMVYASKAYSASIDQYAYNDISGDLNRIIDETVKALPAFMAAYADPDYATSQKKQMEFLGKITPLLAALETMTIGNGSLRDYSYTIPLKSQRLVFKIAESTMGKYSLREMGSMVVKGVTMAPEGVSTPLLELESLGMDGAELPSFIELFKAISQGVSSAALLRPTLQGQDFALKNLNVKNLSVRDPKNPDQVVFSLADGTFSYIAKASHDMDMRFSGMKMAKSLLNRGEELPESVQNLLPSVLSFSGVTQINATRKGNSDKVYDFDCKKIAFKEDSLGQFSLSLSVGDLNAMALAMGMPGPATLKNFHFNARDMRASTVFFTILAEEEDNENVTPESLRAKAISELPPSESLPNEQLRNLVEGIRYFISGEQRGLEISIAPPAPLTLQELQAAALTAPEKLGISVQHTEVKELTPGL